MAHTGSLQRIRRIGGQWLIAVLLTLLSNQSVRAQKAQDHSALGISLAKAGKLAEAESELQQATHGAPGVALYRAQLGSILGLEGKWNEALASFQKAVELAPTNISFRRETAAVQWQLGLMSSAEKNLRYVRGLDKAVEAARRGDAQVAFLLRPTAIEDVARISFSGGVMPQKSTDFYPKLLSGLTIYKVDEA